MTTYKNMELELEKLLSYVLESDASDLHLIVGRPPMVRIDSVLSPVRGFPDMDPDHLERLISVMMSEKQKLQLENKRQVDFSYGYKASARFRVNVYYQKGTLATALRHVPSKIRTLQELNLPSQLEEFTKLHQGLVLVAGPTGHGKSTTLAALIDIVNHSRYDHIITIEDPIEYMFTQEKSIISQREVLQDTENFATAIRATLREDVNVVMVGEMRDLDSIATTITVAETGHLVFATVHTNDAPQTIDRIVDVFPSHQQNQVRAQLANILVGVVSQRLLQRVGGGRIAAIEIMRTSNAVRNVIREGRTFELTNIIQTGMTEGMISMDRYLADLVRKGLVKLEDAMSYAENQEVFRSLIRKY